MKKPHQNSDRHSSPFSVPAPPTKRFFGQRAAQSGFISGSWRHAEPRLRTVRQYRGENVNPELLRQLLETLGNVPAGVMVMRLRIHMS